MPVTPKDAKGLIKAAIRDDNPVLYIEPLSHYRVKGQIPDEDFIVPIGKADIKREGKDVTVVSIGRMLDRAFKAADKLAEEKIEAEVIDLLTLNPLDMETIYKSLEKTNRLVIIHEATKICGVGAEIAADVMENCFDLLDAPVKRIAPPFAHVAFQPALEEAYMPQVDALVQAVKEM
jgi:pyruvate dehydrogenase E1 component beta subunit